MKNQPAMKIRLQQKQQLKSHQFIKLGYIPFCSADCIIQISEILSSIDEWLGEHVDTKWSERCIGVHTRDAPANGGDPLLAWRESRGDELGRVVGSGHAEDGFGGWRGDDGSILERNHSFRSRTRVLYRNEKGRIIGTTTTTIRWHT